MGFAAGCNTLGILYAKGLGVKQNYTKAKNLYKKACNMGFAAGCSTLAFSYINGLGVKQNYTKAKKFYKKSCNMGYKIGCKLYDNLNRFLNQK